MIVRKTGKYKFIEDFQTRTSISSAIIPAGAILEVKQVDEYYRKVFGKPLLDWTHWDLPVEELN